MKLINNILYLSFDEVTDVCKVSDTYLRRALKGQRRGELSCWAHIPDPEDGRKVLVQYDTLKPKYKALVQARYGKNPYTHAQMEAGRAAQDRKVAALSTLASSLTSNPGDEAFFMGLGHYTDVQARQMARACAWLALCNSITGKKHAQQHGFDSKEDLLRGVMEALNKENLHGLGNLNNYRYLLRRLKCFREHGRDSLVSKKHGNNNSRKLGEAQKTLLRRLYAQANKFPFTTITTKYNKIASRQGWKTLTVRTVQNYLAQPQVKTQCELDRHGFGYWRNVNEINQRRKKPSYPDDLWVLDGSPIELFYRDGKNLRKRLYGYLIIDAHSWYPVGYALGESETEQLVFEAIKNACTSNNTLPHQVLADNSSANKANDMLEWYPQVARYVTFATVGNAKAKVIEPFQGAFNKLILKEFANYAGGNITAKDVNTSANAEWLAANKDVIPTKEEAIHQVEKAINAWKHRAMKDGKAPAEKYQAGSPRKRPIDFGMVVSLFWKYRMARSGEIATYKYSQNGLTMQKNGQKYHYLVYDKKGLPDKAFHRQYLHDTFAVKYDPDNMDMVCLYKDGRQVHVAQIQREAPMAIVDYQEGDGEYIQGFLQNRKERLEEIREANRKDDELLEKMGIVIEAEGYAKAPYPVGGRYKDRSNAAETALKGGLYETDDDYSVVHAGEE